MYQGSYGWGPTGERGSGGGMGRQWADRGAMRSRPRRRRTAGEEGQLAKLLGWFSIGLGLAQVAAPREFARFVGIRNGDPTVVRAVGMREITSGIGILTQPRPAGWVWARVGGDLMDLALLGRAHTSPRTERSRVEAATAAVVGVTAMDVLCGVQLSSQAEGQSGSPRERSQMGPGQPREDYGVQVTKAITVRRPIDEVYAFWRDFQNLPRFMSHLEAVQVMGEGRSHWRAKAPAGATVEWDAEMIEDRPNELIAWRSLEGADVPNSGSVRFRPAPGEQGTEVEVELQYDAPGGKLGRLVARLFGEEPSQQVAGDLRRFKQVLETGEIVRSDANLGDAGLAQRPAQPREDARPLEPAVR
jgi:uncharacterized membrane protein